MPTVLRWRGYQFLFYGLDEGEPPHIHVPKGRNQAKFWPSDCPLAKAQGFGTMSCANFAERSRSRGKIC